MQDGVGQRCQQCGSAEAGLPVQLAATLANAPSTVTVQIEVTGEVHTAAGANLAPTIFAA